MSCLNCDRKHYVDFLTFEDLQTVLVSLGLKVG